MKLYSMESSFLPIFLSFRYLLLIHTHIYIYIISLYIVFSNRHYTFKLKGTKLNCLMFYTKSFIIFDFLCCFPFFALSLYIYFMSLSIFFCFRFFFSWFLDSYQFYWAAESWIQKHIHVFNLNMCQFIHIMHVYFAFI